MAPFLPPDDATLLPRLCKRNARRARRVLTGLSPRDGAEREALRAFAATLSHLRGGRRREFLLEPGLRAWLCDAEEVISLGRALRRDDDPRLFDRIARGAFLAEVVPRGRLDARFRKRTGRLVDRLSRRACHRLVALLLLTTPPGLRFGPFVLDRTPDPEEARGTGEIHLGLPAPVTLQVPPATRAELLGDGIRLAVAAGSATIRPRQVIQGTGIVLGRRLVPAGATRRPGAAVPGLSARLARAIDLLARVWQEACSDVLVHTKAVVPLYEPATVSYSQPDRPGISYIRIPGKSLVDLADDMLHETAHHRLHALEEIEPLARDDGEPRYHSPWRRGLRPLRGILHATYTFSYRAQLLARLSMAPQSLRPPGSWIRRELEFERSSLTRSLADLDDARRRGLLLPSGTRLLRAMQRRRPWIAAAE